MACRSIHMWSLTGLIAAFLDLAIAYFLLCASAAAFLASKFLGFFGLNLPCPCEGSFRNISCKDYCLDRLLVEIPTHQVCDVRVSVKRRFPFSYVGGGEYVNGVLENECDVKRELISWEEKCDVKGKEAVNYRQKSRVNRRRKGGFDYGKDSCFLSYDRSCTDKEGNGLHGESSSPVDNGDALYLEYDNKAPRIPANQKISDEDMHVKKNVLSIEGLQDNAQEVQNLSGKEEKNAIQILEKKLEEERSALSALYIDLEKERSAAASAADEAMAMILRLQEEKAAIQMESRQYQRIIEEKSAYDAEEMNILKEILVRRETEKHFLEKEVEAYMQMVQQLQGDKNEDPNDDTTLMLQQLSASMDKRVRGENVFSVGNIDLQEKEMISTGDEGQERNFPEKNEELDKDLCVYDVHVITDCPSTSGENDEIDLEKNGFDLSIGLPPIGPKGTFGISDLQRSSVSVADSEMLKIDVEVGELRERLKIVQKGREKLGFNFENREREDMQLNLLEDISRQIREIRQVDKSGRTVRQVSLPLPNSKALSKKKRCRSVSSGLQ